jgi:hypothetical protein
LFAHRCQCANNHPSRFENPDHVDPLGETSLENILNQDDELDSIPILDADASNILAIGTAIPTSFAQEGAAVAALAENVNADREFPELTGEDADIDVDEIYAACRSLSINKYNHLGTTGSIGSLHTGKVMLYMTEELVEEPEGTEEYLVRRLYPARREMMIAGGQCYMPTFLYNLLGKQRTNHKLLASFPMMLMRALLRYNAGFDRDRNVHLEELFRSWIPIQFMARQAEIAIETSFPSVLRFEFFFGTTLEEDHCDFKFPDIPYQRITQCMFHEDFKERWTADIRDNQIPVGLLMNDIFDKLQDAQSQFKLELFPPNVKTRLLLHAEQLLINLQINAYSGSITKSVSECMHIDPCKQLFFIPEGLKKPFAEGATRFYNLDFGLDPKLLSLPQYTSLENMELQLRRSPRHIQQLGGQMRNLVQSPNSYYHYTGKALRMLLLASAPPDASLAADELQFGLFENPDFKAIAALPVQRKVALLNDVAQLVWDCYDVEWWLMVTEYAKVSVDHRSFQISRPFRKTLETFPRTVDSFVQWEEAYGARSTFFTVSRNFNHNVPEIVTNGESSRFWLDSKLPFQNYLLDRSAI